MPQPDQHKCRQCGSIGRMTDQTTGTFMVKSTEAGQQHSEIDHQPENRHSAETLPLPVRQPRVTPPMLNACRILRHHLHPLQQHGEPEARRQNKRQKQHHMAVPVNLRKGQAIAEIPSQMPESIECMVDQRHRIAE